MRGKPSPAKSFTIINRNINGLHYCIVSDLNAKELADFASLS